MLRWTIAALTAVVMASLYWFVPFTGLEQQPKAALLIFLTTIMWWIIRPIPEYLTALLAGALMICFVKLPGPQVLGGFSSMTWWMTLLAMLLGATINYTGLGRRLAYIFLARYARGPLQLLYATSMVNNLLAPVMPSNTARGALLCGVAEGVCDGVGLRPGEYKGDHTIILTNLYTNTTNTFVFLTATSANLLGLQIIMDMTGMPFTWNNWFAATSVPGIPVLLLLPLLVYKMFPFTMADPEHCREMARQKLAEMGAISTPEKRTAIMLAVIALIWSTEFIHNIPSTQTVFLLIFLLMPGIGAVTWKDVGNRISWSAMIWLGMAIGIAGVINKTGGFKWLVNALFAQSSFVAGLGFVEFAALIIFCIVFMHILFSGMNAMIMIMVPIAIGIAQQRGFDAGVIGLITLMSIAGGAFFMPFNSAPNLIFYATGRYQVKQQLLGAIPLALLICVALLGALVFWWPVIGLVK